MIDLHCHLLPGIDDGPADMEGAIALAHAQVAAGVRVVACTPHVSCQDPNTAAGIAASVAATGAALERAGVPLQIVSGAEVALTRAAELDDAELEALCLAGGEWLLLEAPLGDSAGVEQAVGHVARRGPRILLAHPERCPAFQRDPHALRRLVLGGTVLTQLTAGALTGTFGATVQRFARRLMDERLVHVVASDAHDAVRRPPGLFEALRDTGLAEQEALLTREIPAAIVAGGEIPRLPPAAPQPPRRRWWRRR